jgi:uncharacterized protein YjbI with pentapeptide repeats
MYDMILTQEQVDEILDLPFQHLHRSFENKILKNIDLSDRFLGEVSFRGTKLDHVRRTNSCLDRTTFRTARLIDSDFSDSTFELLKEYREKDDPHESNR